MDSRIRGKDGSETVLCLEITRIYFLCSTYQNFKLSNLTVEFFSILLRLSREGGNLQLKNGFPHSRERRSCKQYQLELYQIYILNTATATENYNCPSPDCNGKLFESEN